MADLTDDQRQTLARLFDVKTADVQAKAEKLGELALSEWVRWIAGTYRPNSITEQTIDRVLALYSDLIGELPELEEVVRRFNLPVGRARYIISSLRYTNHPEFMRKLLEQLDAKLAGAAEALGEENQTQIILTQSLWDQMEMIVGELVAEGVALDWPKALGSNPYTREYQLTKKTLIELRKRVEELRK